MKTRLKSSKARIANMIANGTNALLSVHIDWHPFNIPPIRGIYNWANKVRTNDPVWTEFIEARLAEIESKKHEKETPVSGPILETT